MRLGVSTFYVDGLADFRATLTRLFERERDRGAVTNAMTMLHLLLLDQIDSGDWVRAQESVRVGLELTGAHHNELFRHQFVAYNGLRAACVGDVDAAQRCAAQLDAWAGPRRLGLLLGFSQRISVLTALATGDYQGAYEAALRIGAAGDFPPYSHQSTVGILDFVEAAVHAGHLEDARAHADEATRLRLGEISPRLDAMTTAARAMTAADEDDVDTLYRIALRHSGLEDYPFELNRIRLAFGTWLRRRRRTTEGP